MEDQLLTVLASVALTVVLGLALIVCITNCHTHQQSYPPVMESSQDRGTLVTGSKDNRASDMTHSGNSERIKGSSYVTLTDITVTLYLVTATLNCMTVLNK